MWVRVSGTWDDTYFTVSVCLKTQNLKKTHCFTAILKQTIHELLVWIKLPFFGLRNVSTKRGKSK